MPLSLPPLYADATLHCIFLLHRHLLLLRRHRRHALSLVRILAN
jgi:hypothetical protein